MFRDALLSYYSEKAEIITYNYYLAVKRDVDGIHDMRVAIKRMKALFNLLQAAGIDFDAKKRFKHFKRIAKNSGQLRDAQVQCDLMTKANKKQKRDLSGYEAYLANMEEEGFQQFRKFSKCDPLSKLKGKKKIISHTLKISTPVRAETMSRGRFINLLNNLIMAGRDPEYHEENLHKVRILSKEIHYTFEILTGCLGLYEDRTEFPVNIKKVHSVLGKWHDCEVCLDLIADYAAQSGEGGKGTPLDSFARDIRDEKKRLRDKYKGAVAEFIEYAVVF